MSGINKDMMHIDINMASWYDDEHTNLIEMKEDSKRDSKTRHKKWTKIKPNNRKPKKK